MNEKTFITLDNLNDDKIREIECMCVVQHHEQTEKRLNQIYEGGQIPFIYDCQNKFQKIKDAFTLFYKLENKNFIFSIFSVVVLSYNKLLK